MPLADAGILITGNRITAVGSRSELRRRFPAVAERHYSGSLLLPGLINAHCHLELSCLRHLCPEDRADIDFIDWILTVIAAKRQSTPEDTARGIDQGLDELAAAGTTSIGDHRSPGWFMWEPQGTKQPRPRQVHFLEIIAGDPARAGTELAAVQERLALLPCGSNAAENTTLAAAGCRPGIAPHAPYTVSLPLLAGLRKLAARKQLPVSLHLGETEAEREFFLRGSGPISDRLYPRVGWEQLRHGGFGRDAIDWLLDHLAIADLAAVHLGTANQRQLARLAKRNIVPVVCARSNQRLGNPLPDLETMLTLTPGPALGTDSRASVPSLDPWDELRFLRRVYPTVTADQLLTMATVNGARALGLATETGRLAAGYYADVLVIAGIAHRRASNSEMLTEMLIEGMSPEQIQLVLAGGRRIGGMDKE
jgi:5-methylthioadenosine/S-adenosylhomocysteine deaminase